VIVALKNCSGEFYVFRKTHPSSFRGLGGRRAWRGHRPVRFCIEADLASLSRNLFAFPNPVDEISARLVAGGVVLMCLGTIVLGQPWLVAFIVYGFAARVLTGPTLSPLGLFVTRVLRPRLRIPPRPVPGPPKRFAQGMGLVFSGTAAMLFFGVDWPSAGYALLGLLAAAAGLEAIFGLCLGCHIFAMLMRIGVIPRTVCEACDNLWLTRGDAALGSSGGASTRSPTRP
jgi:hypothetical protein